MARTKTTRRRTPGLKKASAESGLGSAPSQKTAPARKWPGVCPKCGEKLQKYAVTHSTSLGRRTKYWKCPACEFRTKTMEKITGPQPKPVTAPTAETGKDPGNGNVEGNGEAKAPAEIEADDDAEDAASEGDGEKTL